MVSKLYHFQWPQTSIQFFVFVTIAFFYLIQTIFATTTVKFTIFKILCLTSLLSAHGIFARHAASASTNAVSTKKKTSLPRTLGFISRSRTRKSTTPTIAATTSTTMPSPRFPGEAKPATRTRLFLRKSKRRQSWNRPPCLGSSVKLAASDLYPSWISSVFGESLLELLASFLVVFGVDLCLCHCQWSRVGGDQPDPNPCAKCTKSKLSIYYQRWYNPIGIVAIVAKLCVMSRMLKFGIKGSEKESMLAHDPCSIQECELVYGSFLRVQLFTLCYSLLAYFRHL